MRIISAVVLLSVLCLLLIRIHIFTPEVQAGVEGHGMVAVAQHPCVERSLSSFPFLAIIIAGALLQIASLPQQQMQGINEFHFQRRLSREPASAP